MERVNQPSDLDLLRSANRRFACFFQSYCGRAVVGTEEEVAALREIEEALNSVRPLLNKPFRRAQGDEICQELALYRDNLLRLHRELAAMEQVAIGARGSLFVRQKHLSAAQAWCVATRATS